MFSHLGPFSSTPLEAKSVGRFRTRGQTFYFRREGTAWNSNLILTAYSPGNHFSLLLLCFAVVLTSVQVHIKNTSHSKEEFLERVSRECQILDYGVSFSNEFLVSYPHKKSFAFSLEARSSGF